MPIPKAPLILPDGETVDAQMPVIISASRATDIPAFYADWFTERLRQGYVKWKNPFNGQILYLSFERARLVIFWSKNPLPIIPHLNTIREYIPNFYFQYTLNDYEAERFEIGVPPLAQRIETFIELSELTGKEKVIWRFDPLILTDTVGVEELLHKVENIGNQLKNHTGKFVFSFADIAQYRKVQRNLQQSHIPYREFDERQMLDFAAGLQQLNQSWNLQLSTCAEPVALETYCITHNKCIDDDLIIRLFSNDTALMEFLGVNIIPPDIFHPELRFGKTRNNKDKGQRTHCGCIVSKDIGEYNTCPHQCEYCYAKASKELAVKNWKRIRGD